MIDYKKIQEEQPLAWEEFEVFLKTWIWENYGNDKSKINVHGGKMLNFYEYGGVIYIEDRICYDYFDSVGIITCVNYSDSQNRWSYKVISLNSSHYSTDSGFAFRNEAETDAFTKAFSIRESQLTSKAK